MDNGDIAVTDGHSRNGPLFYQHCFKRLYSITIIMPTNKKRRKEMNLSCDAGWVDEVEWLILTNCG